MTRYRMSLLIVLLVYPDLAELLNFSGPFQNSFRFADITGQVSTGCDLSSLGRRGAGSGNRKNCGVRCPVTGAIRHEVCGSHSDSDPRRILGDDINLWARRWAGGR